MKAEDSKHDTLKHKKWVRYLMDILIEDLDDRAKHHDDSKLEEPEKPLFDEYSPKLSKCTYGSEEYKEFLKGLKPALDHHYEVNSHHPEHYENGIDAMNLLDLVEMICDWLASSKRHDDGNIYKSLEINKKRFKMSDQLYSILKNTVDLYFEEEIDAEY